MTLLELLNLRMINGDDRFRATQLTPEQVERYDSELGLIAQKSKQEEWLPGQDLDEMLVTYLKTGVIHVDNNLLRVDSIVKIILTRYNRERRRLEPAPHSMIMDVFSAASRAAEHPDLWLLVSWLTHVSDIALDYFEGRLTTEQLIAGAVIEQMRELKRTKGAVWLRRKKIDPDYVMHLMAVRYGMVGGGHRQSDDYVVVKGGREQVDYDRLPIVQACKDAFNTMSEDRRNYFKKP